MRRYALLAFLLLAYLLVGSLFAVYTPNWQAPDEPAHYNYIRQLADGRFPVIEPGDYDQEYQSEVISSQFDPQYSVESFEYEDYQPPLYYLLQTPIFLLFEGDLTFLRLFSVLLGAGVVILAYVAARQLFPEHEWLALTAAAFLALLPQHVAILASVNNDSLAELLIAAILVLLLVIVTSSRQQGEKGGSGSQNRRFILLGVLLGLGLVTKVTVYILLPVVSLALLWMFWGNWHRLWRAGLLVFGPALLIGATWWVRNIVVYDGLDVLGTAAHNRIVVGQPLTEEWIAERGIVATLQAFIQTTFQSFWGQFGWMGVVMPAWVYRTLLLFSGLTIAGLVFIIVQRMRRSPVGIRLWLEKSNRALPMAILGSTLLLSVLVYLAYNVTFVQHQGRYLFPALIPSSIIVAVAWSVLIRPLAARWAVFDIALPLGLVLALLALDLLALFRFIVPSLS